MTRDGPRAMERAPSQRIAAWREFAVLAVCFAAVVLLTVLDLGSIGDGEDTRIPVLNPALWPVGLGAGLLGVLASALVALVAAMRGGWTRRTAGVHAVVVLTVSVVSAMALSAGAVVNPMFLDTAFADVDRLAMRLGGVLVGTLIIAGGVAVAAIPFVRLRRPAGPRRS